MVGVEVDESYGGSKGMAARKKKVKGRRKFVERPDGTRVQLRPEREKFAEGNLGSVKKVAGVGEKGNKQGARVKVDTRMLYGLIDQGWTMKQVAEELGVSVDVVGRRVKKRQREAVQLVAVSEARPLVARQLNLVDQMQKINDEANRILDLAMGGIRALEGMSFDGMSVMEVTDVLRLVGQSRDLVLKAMAEIRGQMKLQLEVLQQLYDVKAAEEFQDEVLRSIGEVDEGIRDKILDRLRQRRAVRQAVGGN